MTAGVGMDFGMMSDTYRHDIVWIEAHAGHSRVTLVNHRLDGHDVVDVHRQRIDASPPLAVADFAVAIRLSELPRPEFLPSLAVQQLLIPWVSAHTRYHSTPIGRNPSA